MQYLVHFLSVTVKENIDSDWRGPIWMLCLTNCNKRTHRHCFPVQCSVHSVYLYDGTNASVSAFTCSADGDLLLVLHQEVLHHLSCLEDQADKCENKWLGERDFSLLITSISMTHLLVHLCRGELIQPSLDLWRTWLREVDVIIHHPAWQIWAETFVNLSNTMFNVFYRGENCGIQRHR